MTPDTIYREAYRTQAERVAGARIRYAESFLLWKSRGNATSDEKARQHAVIDTKDELTVLLAELEIARIRYEGEKTR